MRKNLADKVKMDPISQMSRQKDIATKKREEKAHQKQGKKVNLSKTSSNQKALSSKLISKANEDLAQEVDRDLLEDFAKRDN